MYLEVVRKICSIWFEKKKRCMKEDHVEKEILLADGNIVNWMKYFSKDSSHLLRKISPVVDEKKI